MIQLTDNIWAVEVPDGAFGFQIIKDQPSILYYDIPASRGECDSGWVQLPPSGSWQYLFTTQGATEEDARQIVRSCTWHWPERHVRFVDYAFPFDHENKQRWSEGFGTGIESLESLLKSKGCDTSKNYAIIENANNATL